MTHVNLEFKTKAELEAKYNDPTPLKMWGTVGDRNRSGVAVLSGETDYGSAGVAKHEYIIGPKGEVRWAKSNNIVSGDILEMAVVDGTISIEVRNTTEQVRIIDDEIAIKNYINFRQKHGYSEEELMEIDAEFGDEEPVDIFTGREIRTGRFAL